jgi:hypothetical protein
VVEFRIFWSIKITNFKRNFECFISKNNPSVSNAMEELEVEIIKFEQMWLNVVITQCLPLQNTTYHFNFETRNMMHSFWKLAGSVHNYHLVSDMFTST